MPSFLYRLLNFSAGKLKQSIESSSKFEPIKLPSLFFSSKTQQTIIIHYKYPWRSFLRTDLSSISMAYIPPHKRRPKNPNSSLWWSKIVANQRNPETGHLSNLYKRWFAVGLDVRNLFPSSVRFQPVPFDYIVQKGGEISMALVNTDLERVSESPWISMAENLTKDLISSFELVRSEMENHGVEAVKPNLVARFGKVIFRSSSSFESMTEASNSEDSLSKLQRLLHTNIPKSYIEYLTEEGGQKIGLELKGEKVGFRVQLFDSTRPCSRITCKCREGKDGKLELIKVELRSLFYMVTDISCLEKNVDLRLILNTRPNATNDLSDDDMKSIRDLVDSAIIDPGVKGGLRWPFGKEYSGDKFTLNRIWHTKTKTYVNSSLKLNVRDSDRFGFGKFIGESSREVFVELKKIVAKLKEPDIDENLIKEMLQDDLRALWESFFVCESFLKWEK